MEISPNLMIEPKGTVIIPLAEYNSLRDGLLLGREAALDMESQLSAICNRIKDCEIPETPDGIQAKEMLGVLKSASSIIEILDCAL